VDIITYKEKLSLINIAFGEGIVSRDGNNVSVQCPKCQKSAKHSNKKKLSISLETGVYHCWVCESKGKNIAYLAKFICIHKVTLDGLCKAFGSIGENKEDLKEEIIALPSDFKLLCTDNSRISNMAKNYLLSRGLTFEDIVKYKVGTSNEYKFINRVIFPSFDKDLNLNFFLARTYDKNQKITYRNCKFSKKEIVFNENFINWNKPMVLVEGVFDAIKAKSNVCCMLGSWIDDGYLLFQKIVKNKTPIILAPDPDARHKAQKIAKNLTSYCIDVKITNNLDKDLGEMSFLEAESYINNAKPFDNTSRIRYLIGDIKSGSIY